MTRRGRKPKAPDKLRKHPVTCRLTDAEAATVDQRRGGMTRGEWIRTAALKTPPRVIPSINKAAWADLARLAGNLNQITRAINQGLKTDLAAADIAAIRDQVQRLRLELLGGLGVEGDATH